jgi:lysyl-tRNA synthetase, class I
MANNGLELIHWADFTAERIIKQIGDKESYVVASGITPSGTVHFGNFREVITVDFVARALRARGKNVRFIFSWDDYDTFRKIPLNMPKQDELKSFLFQPIVDTPDPYGEHDSYAAHHEHNFEQQLDKVGISVEPLYQARKYREGTYRAGIKKALDNRDSIATILNQFRKEPLTDSWWPVSVYCEKCNTDNQIKDKKWNGQALHYSCEACGHSGKEDADSSTRLKLPWRIDWPMRWAHEKVDFEPGGKDHSSKGGSYDTAKDIVKLYDWQAPAYLQYDFVSIKGGGGKMSSSSGELVTINDVLKVYEPEIVRWIFASYKSNVDFAVSFDLDVIKSYEDFDRQERLAYGVDEGNEKKVKMAKRVFELCQLTERPEVMPFQPSFRHLTNVLQINDGNILAAREYYKDQIKNERDERRFSQRANCALFWLKTYAPEDFKFAVNQKAPSVDMNEKQKSFFSNLAQALETEWPKWNDDKDLHERMYEIMHAQELKPNEVFPLCYELLISKEKGPKLAGFIRTLGQERVLNILNQVHVG